MILKRGQHLGFLADASSIDWSLGILGSSSFDYAGLEQMLAKSSILCFQNRRCEAVAFDCYNNLRFVSVSFHERCENMCLPGVIEEFFSFLLEPAGGSGFSEDFHGILGSFCGQPGTTKHHTGSLRRCRGRRDAAETTADPNVTGISSILSIPGATGSGYIGLLENRSFFGVWHRKP